MKTFKSERSERLLSLVLSLLKLEPETEKIQ